MKENEQKIIKKISDLSGDYKCYDNRINHEESLVLDRLLTEIQQYRAIGTVEELQSMKENGAFTGVELANIAVGMMKLKEFQAIGTIKEFKALKENQRRCEDCADELDWIDEIAEQMKGVME